MSLNKLPDTSDVAAQAVRLVTIKFKAKVLEAQCKCGTKASGVSQIDARFGWRYFKDRDYYRPQGHCKECHRAQKRAIKKRKREEQKRQQELEQQLANRNASGSCPELVEGRDESGSRARSWPSGSLSPTASAQ